MDYQAAIGCRVGLLGQLNLSGWSFLKQTQVLLATEAEIDSPIQLALDYVVVAPFFPQKFSFLPLKFFTNILINIGLSSLQ